MDSHPSPFRWASGDGGSRQGQLVWAEPASTMQADSSTASNADAGTVFSWSKIWFVQRLSSVPWKNQFEPLSARIRPYRFIAGSTILAARPNPRRLKLALRRNRAPMGGYRGLHGPASWRAGHRCDESVRAAVKRVACRIAPA